MKDGKIRLRLGSWPMDSDIRVHFSGIRGYSLSEVDPSVETSEWKAIRPQTPSGQLYFIHALRRVETRVLAERDGSIFHGLFGSLVAGAVRLGVSSAPADGGSEPGAPKPGDEQADGAAWGLERQQVQRFLIVGGGLEAGKEEVQLGQTRLVFEPYSVAVNSPAEVLLALRNLMRKSEADLAGALMLEDAAVLVSGSIPYFPSAEAPLVAVKGRISRPYLDVGRFALVPDLRPGERTPLFSISDDFCRRLSWFLRVAEHPPLGHLLAGIVRLEVRSTVGLERAKALANASAPALLQLARRSSADPIQALNPLPITALERELDRCLGDSSAVRGAIFERLAQGKAA